MPGCRGNSGILALTAHTAGFRGLEVVWVWGICLNCDFRDFGIGLIFARGLQREQWDSRAYCARGRVSRVRGGMGAGDLSEL